MGFIDEIIEIVEKDVREGIITKNPVDIGYSESKCNVKIHIFHISFEKPKVLFNKYYTNDEMDDIIKLIKRKKFLNGK
jgi:hypothetical protein